MSDVATVRTGDADEVDPPQPASLEPQFVTYANSHSLLSDPTDLAVSDTDLNAALLRRVAEACPDKAPPPGVGAGAPMIFAQRTTDAPVSEFDSNDILFYSAHPDLFTDRDEQSKIGYRWNQTRKPGRLWYAGHQHQAEELYQDTLLQHAAREPRSSLCQRQQDQ